MEKYELELTNYEVKICFRQLIKLWFVKISETVKHHTMLEALLDADIEYFKDQFQLYLTTAFSYFNLTFKKDDNMLINPQIFLSESLLNIWKNISNKTDSLVVLIDDAQNFSNVKRIFKICKMSFQTAP